MDYNNFKNILNTLIGSAKKTIPTLGKRSSFKVYFDSNENIVLENSGGNTAKITQEDFDICQKQYCSLHEKPRFQGKNYTDPVLRVPIGRTHAPLIPSVFRFLCENGHCVCGNCKSGTCLI